MDETTYKQVEALSRMTVGELRERYIDVFGEETRAHHKDFLHKRIAWRLQSLAEGDLPERAKRRAFEIANDADLRGRTPRDPAFDPPPVLRLFLFGKDNRPNESRGSDGFALKKKVAELFEVFNRERTLSIQELMIDNGLPVRMTVAGVARA